MRLAERGEGLADRGEEPVAAAGGVTVQRRSQPGEELTHAGNEAEQLTAVGRQHRSGVSRVEHLHKRRQCLGERRMGLTTVGCAPAVEHRRAVGVHLPDGFRDEPGLADPGFTGHQDDRATALSGGRPGPGELLQRPDPAGEREVAVEPQPGGQRGLSDPGGTDVAQRREVGARPRHGHPPDPLALLHPAERERAEVDQFVAIDQSCGHAGEQHLATVPGIRDPGHPVERRPEVVSVALLHRAGVDPHPHPHRQRARPGGAGEVGLGLSRRLDCLAGRAEGDPEAVAAAVEHVTLVTGGAGPEDVVVELEAVPHGRRVAVPERGRPLDVGEEEAEGPRRAPRHVCVAHWSLDPG